MSNIPRCLSPNDLIDTSMALVLVKCLIECGHRGVGRDIPIPERLREVGPMQMVDGLKLSQSLSEKAISKILTGALKYCHYSESYGELNDCMLERSGSMEGLPTVGEEGCILG